MKALCQVSAWLLSLGNAFGFVTVVPFDGAALREKPDDVPKIVVAPFPNADFAAIRQLHPELAACVVLSGGTLPQAQSAVAPPDLSTFTVALQRLLAAVTHQPPASLEVFFGFSQQPTASALAFGHTALLLLPTGEPASPTDAARSVATAWLLAQKVPAAPEEGVSEPLLRAAETLAWLGSLALANTPPELLPLGQWVEAKAVAPALEQFIRQSLDSQEPYRVRRARLRELAVPGRASPELGHAAAYLVETFGEPDEARRRPLSLLKAWAENRDKRFPSPPRLLRSALSQPSRAGLARKPSDEDSQALALDEAMRAAWIVPPSRPLTPSAPKEAESLWRARRRAQGLPTPPPHTVAPGKGFCLSRPEPPGFTVSWRGADGEELLLVWPRWVLSPTLEPDGEHLLFVDPEGIWRVSLTGDGVEQVLPGSFRALAVSPSGRSLAALRWPSPRLLALPSATDLGLASAFCWLEEGLLVVGNGQELRIVSTDGTAGAPISLPCHRALASQRGRVVATLDSPCDPALVSVNPATGEQATLLRLPQGALDLVPTGESWAFVSPGGVFLVTGGSVKRLDRAFSLGGG